MSKPLTLLLALVSSTAWFLLAVLGWGGFGAFFAHPARIALVAATVPMLIAGMLSDGGLRSGEREDRGNRWIFIPLFVLSVLAGWLPAWCDRTDTLTLDGDAVRWLGVVLFAVGGIVRIVPVFVLGRRFSGLVAIQPGHTLVTTGIYGKIRHPSYLGLIVMMFGWALAFRSVLGVVLAALTVVPLIARMNSEEALLADQFGEEYVKYRARTMRLIPGIY
jgi:protein-S-isoprenylcysteine O-methyltransferase Ste14